MPAATQTFLTRRRRQIAAWMGIVALALPLLAPIAQGVPALDGQDQSEFPFYMVICKVMQEGTGGDTDKTPNTTDCPVCLSFAFGHSLVLASLDAVALTDIGPRAYPLPEDRTSRTKHLSAWSFARAPPAVV